MFRDVTAVQSHRSPGAEGLQTRPPEAELRPPRARSALITMHRLQLPFPISSPGLMGASTSSFSNVIPHIHAFWHMRTHTRNNQERYLEAWRMMGFAYRGPESEIICVIHIVLPDTNDLIMHMWSELTSVVWMVLMCSHSSVSLDYVVDQRCVCVCYTHTSRLCAMVDVEARHTVTASHCEISFKCMTSPWGLRSDMRWGWAWGHNIISIPMSVLNNQYSLSCSLCFCLPHCSFFKEAAWLWAFCHLTSLLVPL